MRKKTIIFLILLLPFSIFGQIDYSLDNETCSINYKMPDRYEYGSFVLPIFTGDRDAADFVRFEYVKFRLETNSQQNKTVEIGLHDDQEILEFDTIIEIVDTLSTSEYYNDFINGEKIVEGEEVTIEVLCPGKIPEIILELQMVLKEKEGYGFVEFTREWDNLTKAAIVDFNRKIGLPEVGGVYICKQTLEALDIDYW